MSWLHCIYCIWSIKIPLSVTVHNCIVTDRLLVPHAVLYVLIAEESQRIYLSSQKWNSALMTAQKPVSYNWYCMCYLLSKFLFVCLFLWILFNHQLGQNRVISIKKNTICSFYFKMIDVNLIKFPITRILLVQIFIFVIICPPLS